MSAIEQRVIAHYAAGDLMSRIKTALMQAGASPAAPRPEDLKPVDEFHTGGIVATDALLDQIEITTDSLVLDIGSGLGGTARHIARTRGASVTGIDLTADYVATAQALSKMCGLTQKTSFQEGSATELHFTEASFDVAVMLHVGMNIEDKTRLMSEVFRILEPGGVFALFDVMAEVGTPRITFPVPWAEAADFSFVAPPEAYRTAARAAGFETMAERSRRDFAIGFFEKVFQTIEANGMPPLGIHILMGDTAREKLTNFTAAMRAGQIAPYEMIFRKAG